MSKIYYAGALEIDTEGNIYASLTSDQQMEASVYRVTEETREVKIEPFCKRFDFVTRAVRRVYVPLSGGSVVTTVHKYQCYRYKECADICGFCGADNGYGELRNGRDCHFCGIS